MRIAAPLVLSLFWGILTGASLAQPEPLAVQVNRAIDRGVLAVRSWQREDGSFKTSDHEGYPVGNTAFHLYTLLKSGVPADDRQVLAALDYMRYKPLRRTYSAAVLILALDALKDPLQNPLIFSAARWIEANFHTKQGVWAYPTQSHDLSNTQYAVLGLWVAEKHGFASNVEIWGRLLQSLLTGYQKESGGFSYWISRTETGSMTAAAISILALALERVPKSEVRFRIARRKAREALEGAWEYLDRRFVVHANPHGSFAFTRAAHHYYLFGLERVAAITGRKEIGGGDWYLLGARYLVANQSEKGMWGGSSRNTCFPLLFLRRATATTMDRKADPLEGEGVEEKAKATRKPSQEAAYIRRWLLLDPIDNLDDGGLYRDVVHEEKAAPRPGAVSGDHRWSTHRSLGLRVDLAQAFGPGEHRLVHAFTWLCAAEDADAVLWIGHDDDCRVFLDGVLRYEHHFHEARGRDSVAIPVKLTAGPHRLLLKVANWKGDHGFSVRVGSAKDGRLVPGLLPSLDPDGADLAETALAQPEFFTLRELLDHLPLDRRHSLELRKEAEAHRLALVWPFVRNRVWFDGAIEEDPREGPLPGCTGVVRLHPYGTHRPAQAIRKVRLPENAWKLRVRVCADAHPRHRGRVADGRLRLGVYDGELHWIADRIVGPHADRSPDGWVTVEGDLVSHAGKEVLLVVECANGGRTSWWAEDLHIDEIMVLQR